jgi:DNA helicase-2/ATP-dependent DNA helicase PcrA
MEEELAAGVPASSIAFMAFTKAAANEAIHRACTRFNLKPEDLPWFRTLHSAAYQSLGLSRDEVMDSRDWKNFSEQVGEPVTGVIPMEEEQFASATKGDQMLRVVDYASTTLQDLEATWKQLETPVGWWEMKRFADTLYDYKNRTGKMDFTDMITVATGHSDPLNVIVAILDEAQDLTPAQWELAKRLFARATRVYVGGDDDQAIYRWAGADVDKFLGLDDSSREILPISHRLTRSVHEIGQRIINQVQHRFPKLYVPRPTGGRVVRYRNLPHVDLHEPGTWLLLARNGYMLKNLVYLAKEQGVPYSTRGGPSVDPEHVKAIQLWEGMRSGKIKEIDAPQVRLIALYTNTPAKDIRETSTYPVEPMRERLGLHNIWHRALIKIPNGKREFYISCLRRGEKLAGAPRVRIDTIHGVKGAEADNVLLLTDLSYKTARSFEREPEHEHRVFYVGVTRAREALHILAPQSGTAYPV